MSVLVESTSFIRKVDVHWRRMRGLLLWTLHLSLIVSKSFSKMRIRKVHDYLAFSKRLSSSCRILAPLVLNHFHKVESWRNVKPFEFFVLTSGSICVRAEAKVDNFSSIAFFLFNTRYFFLGLINWFANIDGSLTPEHFRRVNIIISHKNPVLAKLLGCPFLSKILSCFSLRLFWLFSHWTSWHWTTLSSFDHL